MLKGPFLVFGGAHVERRGRLTSDGAGGGPSSGRWAETIGGSAFNAACVLGRLGQAVRLISPRGGDTGATALTRAAAAAGIDDRAVTFLDRTTPSRTTLLDAAGELVLSMEDMELYRLFSPRRFRVRAVRDALDAAGGILCDTELHADTLAALVTAATDRGLPVTALVSSPEKAIRVKGVLGTLSLLFLTEADAAPLTGQKPDNIAQWPDILRSLGLVQAVVMGADRLVAFGPEQVLQVRTGGLGAPAERDAIAAAAIAGLSDGLSLAQAVRLGLAAAHLDLHAPHARAADLAPHQLRTLLTDIILPEIAEAEILS